MRRDPRSILSLRATLGEGPVWVARDAALWFVDIKAPAIHRFDPALECANSWMAPAQIGWIVPSADGLFLVGLQTGIHRFDPAHGSFTLVHAPEADRPGNRLNDAIVDGQGQLWFGSMDNAEAAETGRIYRLDGAGCTASGLPSVCITNGPAFSPDGAILYHSDTLVAPYGKAGWWKGALSKTPACS